MLRRLAPLLAGFVLVAAGPAQAQGLQPLPATSTTRFESWQPAAPLARSFSPVAAQLVTSRNRPPHALIGGAIGAAAGVAFCTVVSTLANDSADGGLSACPLSSYLLIGGAGFAVGFAIGWAV